jgi:hypothetical protein
MMSLAQLQYEHPTLVIENKGGACPYQAEGTLYGGRFYFRYRHGLARLNLHRDASDNLYLPVKADYSVSIDYGDDLDGTLSHEEFYDLMDMLILKLTRDNLSP